MYEEEMSVELAAIKGELMSYQPRPSRLDRDQTMFLAGRASVARTGPPSVATRGRQLWPMAFGIMTVVAVTLLVMLAGRPETQVVPLPGQLADHDRLATDSLPERSSASPDVLLTHDPDWRRFRADTPYFRGINETLAIGPYDCPVTLTVSAQDHREEAKSLGYRESLQRLLDTRKSVSSGGSS